MGRRRTLDVDETLSQETPEVQEELLNEIEVVISNNFEKQKKDLRNL